MKYNLELLNKPLPFEQGNMTLWDNEYIATNVLKKHLQKDIDSGSRKSETIIHTTQWINERFPLKGHVLDIGCGPGLYATPLSDFGFSYHGIDISKYQIVYAKKFSCGKNVMFETVDFRGLKLSCFYDVVLMLYGIYSFYCPEDRLQLLKTIKTSLSPGGRVIVEVFTKNHYIDRQDSRDWEYITKNGFWSDKAYLELNAFYKYNEFGLVLVQAARVDSSINVWNSWIQTFDVDTLQSEFRLAGFTTFEIYGSCTGNPYHKTSDVLCMIAG